VTGSRFSDTMTGDNGDNVLKGRRGHDFMISGPGDDTLLGGMGNDTVDYSAFTKGVRVNLAKREGPDDHLRSMEHIIGSPHDDHLTGNDLSNKIYGLGGDDTLIGGGGDDLLNGGTGQDVADYEKGPGGIHADLSAATITGADGTDTVRKIEDVRGTKYDDVLIGNGKSNVLEGENGDDVLIGGEKKDRLLGGFGDDYFEGGLGADYMNGASGIDRVSYHLSPNPVIVDLDNQSAIGEGRDILHSVDDVIGSPFDDYIRGDSNENYLDGGLGNDTLIAVKLYDVLAGGKGSDDLQGDHLTWVTFDTAIKGVNVDLAAGTATGQGIDTLTDIHNVIGSPYDDVLRGNTLDNIFIGLGGNDRLIGDAGDDLFVGGRGDDEFVGGADWDSVTYERSPTGVNVDLHDGTATGDGNDTLTTIEGIVGTMFNDVLEGSRGTNTFVPLRGHDVVDGGGGANDTVSFGAAKKAVIVDLAAGTASGEGIDTLTRIDNVVGSDWDDVLKGDSAANVLLGSNRDDSIYGRGGSDILVGESGADRLDGGSGTDRCIDDSATTYVSCESYHDQRAAGDQMIISSRWWLVYGGLRTWYLGPAG